MHRPAPEQRPGPPGGSVCQAQVPAAVCEAADRWRPLLLSCHLSSAPASGQSRRSSAHLQPHTTACCAALKPLAAGLDFCWPLGQLGLHPYWCCCRLSTVDSASKSHGTHHQHLSPPRGSGATWRLAPQKQPDAEALQLAQGHSKQVQTSSKGVGDAPSALMASTWLKCQAEGLRPVSRLMLRRCSWPRAASQLRRNLSLPPCRRSPLSNGSSTCERVLISCFAQVSKASGRGTAAALGQPRSSGEDCPSQPQIAPLQGQLHLQ